MHIQTPPPETCLLWINIFVVSSIYLGLREFGERNGTIILGVNDSGVIDRWSHWSHSLLYDTGVRLTLQLSTGVRTCSKFEGTVKKRRISKIMFTLSCLYIKT